MSAEELDNLTGAAAAADAETAPPQEPEMTQTAEGEFVPAGEALEEAERSAAAICDGMAQFVESRYSVGITATTRKRGAQKLAPLLVKYDLDSPFLRKWRAEIDAAVFFGGVAWGIMQAVKAQPADAGK